MTVKTQNIKNENGDILQTITHIFSENGHFEQNGIFSGCHISFGPSVDISSFTEVIDEGVTNSFSYDLPDIIITNEMLAAEQEYIEEFEEEEYDELPEEGEEYEE